MIHHNWLFTGGLAKMDEKWYCYIIHREKDPIINGGFKIYPRGVEEVPYQHPEI